ncbi:1376_t:CDS:2, partial [Dentiscutata heterogama]
HYLGTNDEIIKDRLKKAIGEVSDSISIMRKAQTYGENDPDQPPDILVKSSVL